MREVFLSVLNMSVTGCYVIIAVLLGRLLLKKAPKKYSYLLWSTVGFRLACPISFASVLSVFNTGLFNMTKAQSAGETVLQYIPSDIGRMAEPSLTVGISAANTVISERLPVYPGVSSVNPLNTWLLAGTIIWLIGLAALVAYSLLSYLRLRKRVSTAVKLTGNVFEADTIRSPFVLGFVKPRIYIPFGLTEREKSYILRHEVCHIDRKDPVIKLAAFLILCLHWFNPLVWLAFMLMARDMEMSCDEKVLSETGCDIKSDYSASLLSFAVGRRFPGASPLAFGESNVSGRIKNILRFKKPRVGMTALAALLCIAVIVSCAANPKGSGEEAPVTEPSSDVSMAALPDTGNSFEPTPGASAEPSAEIQPPIGMYRFENSIYASPLSSYAPVKEQMPTYFLGTYSMNLLTNEGDMTIIPVGYEASDVDETSFEAQFEPADLSFGIPDISQYSERVEFTLNEQNMSFPQYRVYQMDGEIWLALVGGFTHHIFQLTPVDASDLAQVRRISFQNLDLTVPLPLDYADMLFPRGVQSEDNVVIEAGFYPGDLLFRIVRHTNAEFEDYRAAHNADVDSVLHFARNDSYVYSCELFKDVVPHSPEYAEKYDALLAELHSFVLPGMIEENGLIALDEGD